MRSTFVTLTVAVLLTVSAIANAAPTKGSSLPGSSTSLVARGGPLSGSPVSDVFSQVGLGSSNGSGSSSGGSSGGSSGSDSGSSSGSSDDIEPNKKCGSNSGEGYTDGDSCTEHIDDHLRTN